MGGGNHLLKTNKQINKPILHTGLKCPWTQFVLPYRHSGECSVSQCAQQRQWFFSKSNPTKSNQTKLNPTKAAWKGPAPPAPEANRKLPSVKLDQAQSLHISAFLSRVNSICSPSPGECSSVCLALCAPCPAQFHQCHTPVVHRAQLSCLQRLPCQGWHQTPF